jgi:hypothetical protein
MPHDPSATALMKAVMRDLNARLLDAWKVSIKIDTATHNVWLYLTEPCYAVSAGRWFYTRMFEDGRLPDADIHATIDDLIGQLTNPAFVRAKSANDFRAFLAYREMPKRFDDDPLAERARKVLLERRAKWGDW